jgi:hypothetical protein
MDQLFQHQDVGAVIGVSLSMMEHSRPAVEEEIKNRHPPGSHRELALEEQRPFFQPHQVFGRFYLESGLFA